MTSPFLYKTDPMEHQRKANLKGARKKAFALFGEAGTGKTKVILDNAAYLYLNGEIDTLLVLAPNGVHRQWIEDEVARHLPDNVDRTVAFYRAGLKNHDVWAALQVVDKLVIVAFNIETLSNPTGVRSLERFFHVEAPMRPGDLKPKRLAKRAVMMAIDESHAITTPSSKRTRNAWRIGELAKYRRIGTGTEIRKGLENLYAQFRFLDPGILKCRTFTEFKTRYCVMVGPFNDIVSYKNVEELMALIEPYCFVVEKKDCMDLPPQTFIERVVELTPEQKRLTSELSRNYVTELACGTVVEAELAITRLQKLQQIAGGHIKLEDKTWRPVEERNTAAVIDILETEARGQTIIWASWQPDILQVSEALTKAKIKHVTYYGGNSSTLNAANLKAFRSDPSIKVFLATYATGGTGLTINEADTVIHYTLTFDAVLWWQSLSRNHRKGQDKPVTYHTLVRPGSPDRKLLRALKNKESVAKLMRNPEIFKQWLVGEDPG